MFMHGILTHDVNETVGQLCDVNGRLLALTLVDN